ncbi:MAG: GDSL-type esterase/lipase family protein [Bacteroidota bacterium]
MNVHLKCIFLSLSIAILQACNTDDNSIANLPNNDTAVAKIMPLGASRVEGARPIFESYRYELWKDLVENGWAFDFVGTNVDEASYPTVNNSNFDIDHEGRSGWTSGQILAQLNTSLTEIGAPDIVLFSSPGGNDALLNLPYDQAIANINGIIDVLQASNPNVTIVMEQMAPGLSSIMTQELTAYFTNLQQDAVTIAAQQSTTTSRVIVVDMFTGFSDALLADTVHYNEAGAEFIATRYYNVLVNLLQQ